MMRGAGKLTKRMAKRREKEGERDRERVRERYRGGVFRTREDVGMQMRAEREWTCQLEFEFQATASLCAFLCFFRWWIFALPAFGRQDDAASSPPYVIPLPFCPAFVGVTTRFSFKKGWKCGGCEWCPQWGCAGNQWRKWIQKGKRRLWYPRL